VTSFTFTLEQIKSAPPEVRLWIEQIAAAIRSLALTTPAPAHTLEVAACTPEEALRLFEMIRHDFAAVQVFLEMGREQPAGYATACTRSVLAGLNVGSGSPMTDSPTASRLSIRASHRFATIPKWPCSGSTRRIMFMCTRLPIAVSETSGKSWCGIQRDSSQCSRPQHELRPSNLSLQWLGQARRLLLISER
jgi:hypothetical protein